MKIFGSAWAARTHPLDATPTRWEPEPEPVARVDSLDTESSSSEDSSIVESESEAETDATLADPTPLEDAVHTTLSSQAQAVRDANTFRPALFFALMHDQLPAAQRLLDGGADIHWRGEDDTCILDALVPASTATAQWFLQRPELLRHKGQTLNLRTVLDQPDRDGSTLLHHAAEAGNAELVRMLLAHGADPLNGNSDSKLPLQYAIEQGHLETVKLLLPRRRLGINDTASTGNTLLHDALSAGQLVVARWLLRQGAQLDRVNDSGTTLWHALFANGSGPLAPRWLHKQIRRRGQAAPDVNRCDAQDATALLLATRKNATAIVAVLLKQPGVDPNASDNEGWAPLHHAARHGATDSLLQLLAHPDIDILRKGPEGRSFLHFIARRRYPLALLLAIRKVLSPAQFQALKDARDDFDTLPVSTAAEHGARDAVLALLRPSLVAAPVTFKATTFRRGWILEGDGLEWRDGWAQLGRNAGIEMHAVGGGDGGEALTFQKLKRLDIQPGDFVIVSTHSRWSKKHQRLEMRLSPGVRVPLVDIAKLLYEKGVLKVLFLGCWANMAMTGLRNRFARDPMVWHPDKGPTPLEGLDFTLVGRKGVVNSVLDDRAVALWIEDGAARRAHTQQTDGAVFNRSVQPMRTMGWDMTTATTTITTRYRLNAHQLGHLQPAQASAVREELLLLSVCDGRIEEATSLLARHQVNPDTHGGNGVTPLMLACKEGRPKTIQLLLQHNANVHLVDIRGRSALWRTCDEGYVGCTRTLIAAGADPHLKDGDGVSPWDIAEQKGRTAILKLLPPPRPQTSI